jgi:hypothetical protein
VPDVPPELDQLVARLLAKDPAHRPANALAVGRSLAAIAGLPDTSPGMAATSATGRSPAAGTVHDQTRAATAAAAQPAAVDQFAATQAMPVAATPAPGASATRAHTHNASPSAFAGAPTVPTVEPGAATPPAANRFTTVEELHRAARRREEAERRRQRLWQAVATVATVAAAGAAVFLLARRRTADELHGRITAVAADETADLRDVRPLIDQFLTRHPQDPRAAAVRSLALQLDVDALERRTRRRQLTDKPLPPIERDYRAAMAREPESPAGCVAALDAILAVTPADASAADGGREPTEVWLGLVRRQIDRLGPLAAKEREQDDVRARAVLAEAAELARAAAAEPVRSAELSARRKTLLESLVELNATRPHMAAIVDEARRLLAAAPAAATTPLPEQSP